MTRGLAIVGRGKMGRLIEQLAPEYGFEVRLSLNSATNERGVGLTRENLRDVDAAVEFSTPLAAAQNIRQLAALGVPVVAGTTGWLQELACVHEAVQSSGAALVWSPNFSVGVHRFRQIIARAGRRFCRVKANTRRGLGDPPLRKARRALRHAVGRRRRDEARRF